MPTGCKWYFDKLHDEAIARKAIEDHEHLKPTIYMKTETNIQMLKLADDLFPGLEDGTKRVTLRKGYRDIKLGPLVIESVSGNLPAVTVEVVEVRHKSMSTLTLKEAKEGGFKNLKEVVGLMQRFYPDFTNESEITLIYFRT